MKLIIVESPKKIGTVKKYVGAGFEVAASIGHVRDLPSNTLGLTDELRPTYVETKPDVIKKLRTMAKRATQVILMTDLDREGEAIAFHLIESLGLKDNYVRCTTNNLNKEGILNALSHPRKIEMNQVYSQEARRVLDRLIGYKVSPVTQALLSTPSAGRVQTPACRLVVERQELIDKFSRVAYLDLQLVHGVGSKQWTSRLDVEGIVKSGNLDQVLTPEVITNGKPAPRHITNGQFIQTIQKEVFNRGLVTVKSFTKRETRTKAPAPFTTSSLLQACSSALGFSADTTMKAAQGLFEAGLITYHRTDSTAYDPSSIKIIRSFIEQWQAKQGAQYLSPQVNQHKVAEGAQAGHEAIRPTNLHLNVNEIEDSNQKAMYQLIFCRTIASQMSDAVYDKTDVVLNANFAIANTEINFVASGRITKFEGWKKIYNEVSDDPEQAEEKRVQTIPPLTEGESIKVTNAEIDKKTTKPPARYTEATLIHELEKRGIGRPSTFASTISTLYKRSYCKKDGRFIVPTPAGRTTIENLRGKFQFADYEYTAEMEASLDRIANGTTKYEYVVPKANQELLLEIDSFSTTLLGSMRSEMCKKCNRQSLLRKESKQGVPYWQCYHDTCDGFYPDKGDAPNYEFVPPEKTDFKCRLCDKGLNLTPEKEEKTRYFYCSDKRHKFIVPAVIADNGKVAPDYNQWDQEHKYKCPSCDGGFLRLTRNEDKFYCSNNFSKKSCGTFLSVATDGSPDYDKFKQQQEEYKSLHDCPVCKNGKLKLTKAKDKFFCSNSFEKGRKRCKTFIPADGNLQPDFEAWKTEQSENTGHRSKPVDRCPICSTPLHIQNHLFRCSNGHEYHIKSDKTPDLDEMASLQNRTYV